MKDYTIVEVLEDKMLIQPKTYTVGDVGVPHLKISFKHLFGEATLSGTKLQVRYDLPKGFIMDEYTLEKEEIEFPVNPKTFYNPGWIKIFLVLKKDADTSITIPGEISLRVRNVNISNEEVEPVYDVLIGKIDDHVEQIVSGAVGVSLTTKTEPIPGGRIPDNDLSAKKLMVTNDEDKIKMAHLSTEVKATIQSDPIPASRIPNNEIPASKLRTASDADKVKLINLSDEVISAMSGNSPVRPEIGDGEIVSEKIADGAIDLKKINKTVANRLNYNEFYKLDTNLLGVGRPFIQNQSSVDVKKESEFLGIWSVIKNPKPGEEHLQSYPALKIRNMQKLNPQPKMCFRLALSDVVNIDRLVINFYSFVDEVKNGKPSIKTVYFTEGVKDYLLEFDDIVIEDDSNGVDIYLSCFNADNTVYSYKVREYETFFGYAMSDMNSSTVKSTILKVIEMSGENLQDAIGDIYSILYGKDNNKITNTGLTLNDNIFEVVKPGGDGWSYTNINFPFNYDIGTKLRIKLVLDDLKDNDYDIIQLKQSLNGKVTYYKGGIQNWEILENKRVLIWDIELTSDVDNLGVVFGGKTHAIGTKYELYFLGISEKDKPKPKIVDLINETAVETLNNSKINLTNKIGLISFLSKEKYDVLRLSNVTSSSNNEYEVIKTGEWAYVGYRYNMIKTSGYSATIELILTNILEIYPNGYDIIQLDQYKNGQNVGYYTGGVKVWEVLENGKIKLTWEVILTKDIDSLNIVFGSKGLNSGSKFKLYSLKMCDETTTVAEALETATSDTSSAKKPLTLLVKANPRTIYTVCNNLGNPVQNPSYVANLYLDSLISFDRGTGLPCIEKGTRNDTYPILPKITKNSENNFIFNDGVETKDYTANLVITDGLENIKIDYKQRSTLSTVGSMSHPRILIIGDSITAGAGLNFGNFPNKPASHLVAEFFAKEQLTVGDSTKYNVTMLGTVTRRNFEIEHNNIKKTVTTLNEGRGGWSLYDYLRMSTSRRPTQENWDILGLGNGTGTDFVSTVENKILLSKTCENNNIQYPANPFFDNAKVGTNRFNIAKWLERYRTIDDATGNRMALGDPKLGTYITSQSKLEEYNVATPTHVIIQLGTNDLSWIPLEEHMRNLKELIEEIKQQIPGVFIAVSPNPRRAGTLIPEYYPNCLNVQTSSSIVSSLLNTFNFHKEIITESEEETDRVFLLSTMSVTPTAYSFNLKPYLDPIDTEPFGTTIYDSFYDSVHLSYQAQVSWAYQEYAWIKYTLTK